MQTFNSKLSQKLSMIVVFVTFLAAFSCDQLKEKSGVSSQPKAPSTTIQEAAFFGNTKAIKEHIAYKSDLNEKDAYGSTPLHIAITFGKQEAAILLINGGADLNATGADGATPLHTAAFFCRTEIVKALLEKGVDVSLKDAYGCTALESVSAPFNDVKPVYEQLSKELGPLGLKLDFEQLESTRPVIAEMIVANTK